MGNLVSFYPLKWKKKRSEKTNVGKMLKLFRVPRSMVGYVGAGDRLAWKKIPAFLLWCFRP